jgi:hypothetical protein
MAVVFISQDIWDRVELSSHESVGGETQFREKIDTRSSFSLAALLKKTTEFL